jgi:hypothetical protein
MLALIKEVRSHEVAIAELNHLSSSKVTLFMTLTLILLILFFILIFNLSLSFAALFYGSQVLVKITLRVKKK